MQVQKKNLLFLPFLAGLVLMVYSWFVSYPLNINSVNDLITNHLSILYWFSMPLLLGSMFSISIAFENKYLKWIMAIGIVITIYSISFFYYTLPGIDEHYFRGLESNLIRTGSLNILNESQTYYQWPLFFILAKVIPSITGLSLKTYEFIIYLIISVLLATGIYIFAAKKYPRSGCIAVIAFFMAMFYTLNFQAVPFSIATTLLFLLFAFTIEKRSIGVTSIVLFLFLGTTLTHAFVPVFFVLYLLIRSIFNNRKYFLTLFALTLSIYLVVELTMAARFLASLLGMLPRTSEYSFMTSFVNQPLAPELSSGASLNTLSQTFSRPVTIAFLVICATGFFLLFIKKKLKDRDIAVFLTGAIYFASGYVFYLLGTRTISVAFIPASLGLIYLFESKVKRFLIVIILILVVLFAFVPLHSTFSYTPITFQTKEGYQTANFMLEKYNWGSGGIVSDSSILAYIYPQLKGEVTQFNEYSEGFSSINLTKYDIMYTVGFARVLVAGNFSTEQVFTDRNIIYHSGSNFVALKSGSP